jgi:His/Glu/Gln/Arg/opine family amino acid ABC transporter permease subunit
MIKSGIKIFLFLIVFGVITQMIPRTQSEDSQTEPSLDYIFYSTYKYQTITPSKLDFISDDFYLPKYNNDIELNYSTSSPNIAISSQTTTISLRTGDIEVYVASIENNPTIWKQQEDFSIQITYLLDGQTHSDTLYGQVNKTMPDDFLGGTLFTIIKYSQMFIDGAIKTIILALVGTIAGFFIALVLVFMRVTKIKDHDSWLSKTFKKVIQKTSFLYITIFRGTPMIVQASFFWYGFGLFGDPYYCGLFVVSINTAAYIAEILRGGIQSIDKGQNEAAKSLGMNQLQTMIYVIFPQAIKNSLPAIGNEFIVNIKDTAVLSVIGIYELFNQGKRISGMHYRQLEVYLIIALIYLFLTYSISTILKYTERRMNLQVLDITSSN